MEQEPAHLPAGAMRCAASSGSAALTKEGDVIVWGFATRAARPRRVALEGAVVAQIALSGAPWAEAVVKVGGEGGTRLETPRR